MKLTRAHMLILGGLAVLAAVLFLMRTPQHRIITLRDDGFSPRTLTIRAGDTVTFADERSVPFWPASDYHPTHSLYPAFDSKAPVPAGASWSFTFDTAGTYPFHDHLNPKYQGVIIVGTADEARAACLKAKSADTLFPECWALGVQDAVSQKGLVSAFTLIDEWYATDPRFRENCHDVMHIVGADAYKEFKADASIIDLPQTAYCGYGFYHGFIEAMVAENGPTDYADARAYCDAVDAKDGQRVSGPCFHGFGHATFDSLDGSLWGDRDAMVGAALAACGKALTTDFSRAQCADGVYNSLANAMSAHSYYTSFDSFDPVRFCSAQPPPYREGCYGETGIGYIREKLMTRTEAFAYLETIPAEFRQYMYFIYFSDETKRAIADFPADVFRTSCLGLAQDAARKGCIEGVTEGIREESQANKAFRTAFPFCAGLPQGALRAYCYADVADHASAAEVSQNEFQTLCAASGSPEVQCK